jgi:hypothetical protein
MKKVLTTVLLSTMILGGVITATQTAHADQNGKPGGTLHSQGSIKYFPDKDPVNPVDPDNPTPDPVNPVNPDPDDPTPNPEPGTDGPLSLDYVPDLYFGLNKITTKDETYNAYATPLKKDDGSIDKYVPTYTQVTDKRGAYTGWTLTVAEKDPFTSTSSKATLGDATSITLTNQKVAGIWKDATAPSSLGGTITLTPNNEAQKVVAAKANEGEGTWISSWGQVSTEKRYTPAKDTEGNETDPTLQDTQVDNSVQLTVPGSVKKMAERYVTNLDWVLTDTPAQ